MRILFILLLCFTLFGEDEDNLQNAYPENKEDTVSINEGYALKDCKKIVDLDDKLSKDDRKLIIDNAIEALKGKKYTYGGYFVFHHNGARYVTIENFSREHWRDEQGNIVDEKSEKRKVGFGKVYKYIKGKFEALRFAIEFD